jgi:hypothetical protein
MWGFLIIQIGSITNNKFKKTISRFSISIAFLDKFVSVKNGYSVWKHLVPFAIAALLLITLSIPTDNLFLKLVNLLQYPSLLRLPAGLLTIVSTIVYILTINIQIHQGYLWSDGDRRRTIGTSLFFIILCTALAIIVLWSISTEKTTIWDITFWDVWASYLLAILSLTGIGWSGPNSWVKSVGIKYPNYTDGRLAAKKLTIIIQGMQNGNKSCDRDVKDFSDSIEALRSNIEKNLEQEPKWTVDKLREISSNLRDLQEQVMDKFLTDDKAKIDDFAEACRCKKKSIYGTFIDKLNSLSKYWNEWQCELSNGGG